MRRTGQYREIPPPLELECLRALWTLGEADVKGVREIVTKRRNLAYTTVMTVLDRLTRRGSVARRRAGRAFIYSPVVSRETLQRLALEELIHGLFDGSREQLENFLSATDWTVPAAIEVPEPEPVQALAAAVGSPVQLPPITLESGDGSVPAEEDHLDAALL